MRILITNDDGIRAPGLDVMREIAQEIAGKDGQVWVVAPELEQSGVGHAISYVNPMRMIKKNDYEAAVEGMPADCVLAGIYELMGEKPDLVLSGVNRGNNAGQNTLYSGTIGAAMEGALQGVKSIAMSQYLGPENKDLDDIFECARQWGAKTVRAILDADTWGQGPYGVFYNVNFPPLPAKACKGHKAVTQGFRQNTDFHTVADTGPNGRKFLWVTMGSQHQSTEAGTDVHAALDGYISVTPMQANLTDENALSNLQKALT